MRVLAILGSARGDGDTGALLDAVLAGQAATRIDLRDLEMGHYEYGASMERDRFSTVADAMVSHQLIVLATPVYWYSMSGRMKIFFDRLTDLVTVRKDLGRQLQDRRLVVLACGSESLLPEGFEVPFRDTAAYFGMRYGGAFYAQTNRQGLVPAAAAQATAFSASLFEATGEVA